MEHRIDLTSTGPRGEAMASAIESCVHCGFCLAACPTYRLLGEEMDSPRGRIVLMKGVLEGNLTAEEAASYIDRCLGCLACMPACPSGVEYNHLLMGYRANTETHRKRPMVDRLARKLVTETLPYPTRFRAAARSGRLSKPLMARLPDKLGVMIGMVPNELPEAQPLPAVFPAQGKQRARVALLAGCVQTVLAPDINWATLRVLAANGIETLVPQGQGCCGSILIHIGEDQQALQLARNNLKVFPDDVDAILTNSAGCGSGMHEYGLLFAGEPEQETAETFAGQVQDVTVFLDELGLRTPPRLPQPLTAVYQDACHLLHAQGIGEEPRRLLAAVDNLTIRELNDGGLCCGSAGTYNLEQPQLASELGELKAERIIQTDAEAVISGNIGCLTQLQSHLALQGAELPLYHTMQMLDIAYRGEMT